MFDLSNFDALQIGLAAPEKILEWSYGEVLKPETINYRTLKPERDGLYCERIFGPTKDWECHCGKYKRVRYKGIICDKCGVEVTYSKVRRERMGHIKLAAPVSHIWYFKGTPSRMGLLLDISFRHLDRVLYFGSYIVTDKGDTDLMEKQVLSEQEYHEARDMYGDRFVAGMGAEAIKELLMKIDLDALCAELRDVIENGSGQKKAKAIKRLEIAEAFRKSNNRPEWMVMDVIPVIPPDIRPMVQLDGGRFATSDLNDLYRRVINRNNRLKRLLELGAPDIIVRNEKRMLQEAVDALIDNGRRGRPVTGPGNRPLKSLSDMLRGKQGRFRQNLLGKRVDYSGRSVIVVGPELKLNQCGVPKEIALELFKPFVMKKLVRDGYAHNIKSAKRMVERVRPEVWDILEDVIQEHPVMLNRAPTLHRLGIQAFEPILVEGRAIKIHPLVCTAFNADFDGDQMAIHLPLSIEAQAEARYLMLSTNNILKPQDGRPVITPTQDMVMGCYYLTLQREGAKGEGRIFADENEAIMRYEMGDIDLQAKIRVRIEREWEGEIHHRIIETSVGRLIFNAILPQNLGYVKRETLEDQFKLEVDKLVVNKDLGDIIDRTYQRHGNTATAEVVDNIKALGFKFATRGAITVSISDIAVPEEKRELLTKADERVKIIESNYREGMISENERYRSVVETWRTTTDQVTAALQRSLDQYNPIYMMANSGARGNMNQIRQLGGMRGLIADPSGRIVEVPIRANFREGLNVLEFFVSAHGSRKGLADTALRTADSGYLTRRLVDVCQDMIIREDDCFASRGEKPRGIVVEAIYDGTRLIESLQDRIWGRVPVEDVCHPETGEVLAPAGEVIGFHEAAEIARAGIEKVEIRSILTCRNPNGICTKCYGIDLATGRHVHVGETVGIIAAQAIGEPGTQLTMRTFHTGGVATAEDITQGLPRVQELFEARKPKGQAVMSEIGGKVTITETNKKREVTITSDDGEAKTYTVAFGATMKVHDGDVIDVGQPLTTGPLNPHDILKIMGIRGVQDYLLKEVKTTYQSQGVNIACKHIEVILRQMMRKVLVEEAGDAQMLPGEMVDIFQFEQENERVILAGGQPAIAKRILLGITKASLATNSFLAASSFQETTRVLTDAAIKGKIDHLVGLKENIIIGKLIPAGTGMKRYKNITINTEKTAAADEVELAVSADDYAENDSDLYLD